MKTNKMKAIGLALAIAAVSANATSLTYNSHGAGANVTINFPGHTNYQVYAGALNCSLTAAPAGYPTPFKAFCVDLQHSISRVNPNREFREERHHATPANPHAYQEA